MIRLPRLPDSLRPTAFEDYIGQEHIKETLWTSIYGAKQRGEPLDHVLLNGPPGLGKTTLAHIIANEMDWDIQKIIGPSLSSPTLAVKMAIRLKPKQMLFIDEIHRMRKPVQEVLYPLLEDGKVFSPVRQDMEIEIVPTTVIGATTDIGKLAQPFIDRFGLQFQLEYYTFDELASIIVASGQRLHMEVSWPTADEIAKRSRGTPRLANNFLKRIRDYSDIYQKDPTPEFAAWVIKEKLYTDELGLRPLDRRYLKILAQATAPMGAEAIASRMQEDIETIESFVEPYLMKLGFVERRASGRWLTQAGKNHVSKIKSRG